RLANWLANLAFVSFEALPCQRGGIIEIAITLASPFSRFFLFFYRLNVFYSKRRVFATLLTRYHRY
ncbi:hypothetical protein ACPV3O_19445, partial [Vibrio rotiferianus]|uniref:hypothetical protein n=1 Tax=Vibrio rotiferianus TaxID=190895 RepID=UPI00406A6F32